jgi:hypothetical protein
MSKLVMVETLSQFRHRYVVEIPDDSYDFVASDYILYNDDAKEMSQHHLGEIEFSKREITKEEYIKLFNEDNDYLVGWLEDNKLAQINKLTETK